MKLIEHLQCILTKNQDYFIADGKKVSQEWIKGKWIKKITITEYKTKSDL